MELSVAAVTQDSSSGPQGTREEDLNTTEHIKARIQSRAADRLKILIAINCAIKKFNHD